MLSAAEIKMPVSSTLNEQGMSPKEEARLAAKNAKNNFSKLDDLSHAVRTPLHVLGGYVAGLQKFSQGFSQLKMPDPALRINLFRRSANLARYLSTIQAQSELLAGGEYVEFFRQTSSKKSDKPEEASIALFRETLASLASHINRLQAAQEKLKTLVRHYERVNPAELKNQFDEIAMEIQVSAAQIKKETDDLNGTLPLAVSAPPAQIKKNLSALPLRILIVDDMPMNRKVLARLIGKQYHCEFASNGKEAVEKYAENHFDIIFMDIQMPVMDGLEATLAIRQQELATNKRRTPVIASTAIDSGALEKGITVAAGMDGYIMKPYDEKRVQEIIHLHTDKREKACPESESDMDERSLTPTFPRRKILWNGLSARSLSGPATANSRVISPASDPGPSRFSPVLAKNPALLSVSPWNTPSNGHGLLARFHLLRHENKSNLAAEKLLSGSDRTPRSSPLLKSFL